MKEGKYYLVYIGIALVCVGLLVHFYQKGTVVPAAPSVATSTPVATSTVATTTVSATTTTPAVATTPALRFEVVTTPAAQALGLGGRTSVPDNYAMLFAFPTDDKYGFWMKDTLVPIDIIWLDDSGHIVKLLNSLSPSTYPTVYYPDQPVRYVLETRAGYAKDHGWTLGTFVQLPAPYQGA